jgi:hypothetical protein
MPPFVAWIAKAFDKKLVFRKSSARGVGHILQAPSPVFTSHIKSISKFTTSDN